MSKNIEIWHLSTILYYISLS